MQGSLFDAGAVVAPRPANALARPLGVLLDEVDNDWRPLLSAWRASPEGIRLIDWVDARVAAGAVIFPADVFRALRETPCASARVVILGQDPYHGPGQAEGLAFSVPGRQPIPPSLRNIFKELGRSFPQRPAPASGHLGPWSSAGVLLLNTVLTVAQGAAGSHAKQGWELLTDQLIAALAAGPPKVFMLWGAHAQSRRSLMESAGMGRGHLVLQSNHPSPLSALRPPSPFIGCGHFVAASAFLSQSGRPWVWPPL